MLIYEKWNEDKTEVLSTIINPDSLKLSKMKGYLLVVEPTINYEIEQKGSTTFTPTERSWEVISLPQETIDAIAQSKADNLELETEIANNPLSGATFEEVASLINALDMTDKEAVRTILRKMAKAILILNKRMGVE
jgi:hypothetical protein